LVQQVVAEVLPDPQLVASAVVQAVGQGVPVEVPYLLAIPVQLLA
tara:strand:- start:79 stop:213 length:135 start_codon:yes stop_codon:yes gene_type:complete